VAGAAGINHRSPKERPAENGGPSIYRPPHLSQRPAIDPAREPLISAAGNGRHERNPVAFLDGVVPIRLDVVADHNPDLIRRKGEGVADGRQRRAGSDLENSGFADAQVWQVAAKRGEYTDLDAHAG
jgi:hypothetical protein